MEDKTMILECENVQDNSQHVPGSGPGGGPVPLSATVHGPVSYREAGQGRNQEIHIDLDPLSYNALPSTSMSNNALPSTSMVKTEPESEPEEDLTPELDASLSGMADMPSLVMKCEGIGDGEDSVECLETEDGEPPHKTAKVVGVEGKKMYETNRRRKWLPRWTKEWTWLDHDPAAGHMFCKICREYPDLAEKSSSFYKGNHRYRCDGFRAHARSRKHKACCRMKEALEAEGPIPDLTEMPNENMDKKVAEEMENLFHIAYYLVKREKPFRDFPYLQDLCRRTGGQVPQCYRHDKACAKFVADIYQAQMDNLVEIVQRSEFMSVIIGSTTDKDAGETSMIYVRVVDNGEPRNVYLSIDDVTDPSMEGLVMVVEQALSRSGLINWHELLVGFGCDGASVSSDNKNGLAARLKQLVPHLLNISGVPEHLEKGVMEALRENPQIMALQECLQLVYQQYLHSPKVLSELGPVAAVAEALEEGGVQPDNPGGAKGLTYIHKATKIVCDSYQSLVGHFEELISSDKKPRASASVCSRVTKILLHLKNYTSLLFMHFLCDVLDVISEASHHLQKGKATDSQTIDQLAAIKERLLGMKKRLGPSSKQVYRHIASNRGSYQSVGLAQFSGSSLQPEREGVIDVIMLHLQARLEEVQKDSILSRFWVALDHAAWPRDDPEELARTGLDEVLALMDHYEGLLSEKDVETEDVLGQYADYKVYVTSLGKDTAMREVFRKVLTTDLLRERFSALRHLMTIYLLLGVSTAVCDPGFALLRRAKGDWRACLSTTQLSRLMYCCLEGPDLDHFDAAQVVQRWLQVSRRVRKPGRKQRVPKQHGDVSGAYQGAPESVSAVSEGEMEEESVSPPGEKN